MNPFTAAPVPILPNQIYPPGYVPAAPVPMWPPRAQVPLMMAPRAWQPIAVLPPGFDTGNTVCQDPNEVLPDYARPIDQFALIQPQEGAEFLPPLSSLGVLPSDYYVPPNFTTRVKPARLAGEEILDELPTMVPVTAAPMPAILGTAPGAPPRRKRTTKAAGTMVMPPGFGGLPGGDPAATLIIPTFAPL